VGEVEECRQALQEYSYDNNLRLPGLLGMAWMWLIYVSQSIHNLSELEFDVP
jgi:hypothetical protein